MISKHTTEKLNLIPGNTNSGPINSGSGLNLGKNQSDQAFHKHPCWMSMRSAPNDTIGIQREIY